MNVFRILGSFQSFWKFLWPETRHLRHWLHFWQLRTTIWTIRLWSLNTEWWWQHSQFLRCFKTDGNDLGQKITSSHLPLGSCRASVSRSWKSWRWTILLSPALRLKYNSFKCVWCQKECWEKLWKMFRAPSQPRWPSLWRLLLLIHLLPTKETSTWDSSSPRWSYGQILSDFILKKQSEELFQTFVSGARLKVFKGFLWEFLHNVVVVHIYHSKCFPKLGS